MARYRRRPSDRSMRIRFALVLAFALAVEVLMCYGLTAWWGDEWKGAVAAVAFGIYVILLMLGGYALDACQHREFWETTDYIYADEENS